jgi:hypothetical protein
VTLNVGDQVKGVRDQVTDVGGQVMSPSNQVTGVGGQVMGIGDQVRGVDNKVKDVDEKVKVAIEGTYVQRFATNAVLTLSTTKWQGNENSGATDGEQYGRRQTFVIPPSHFFC